MKRKLLVLFVVAFLLVGCAIVDEVYPSDGTPTPTVTKPPAAPAATQPPTPTVPPTQPPTPTPPPMATQPPAAEITAQPVLVLPQAAMPLLKENGTPKGYVLILTQEGPASISVPEGGFTFVALGNGRVGSLEVTSDGTIGNIVLFMGMDPDGTTPQDLNGTIVVDQYTVGHVAVTTLWPGSGEEPRQAVLNAVRGMFSAPNCGAEGCVEVHLYTVWPSGQIDEEVFTSPPTP